VLQCRCVGQLALHITESEVESDGYLSTTSYGQGYGALSSEVLETLPASIS
jgi:hypothetical protein